ncbi:hypothetical protein F5Y17DRAFT_411911 [Xylariaceae sp. FL0594]|nr:hypothetical protein F5Y17DRAFT_411911 [Xylariaceae sp. FL0594]
MLGLYAITALAATAAANPIASRSLTANPPVNYPYDYSSVTCPDPDSLSISALITPTYGTTGGVFVVCSSIDIAAPASVVRDAILDYKSYPVWNSFVVSVELPANVTQTPRDVYAGMPMTFTTAGLVTGVNTTSNEILTVVNGEGVGEGAGGRPYLLVAWRYDDGLGGAGSRAEHPCVIVDLGNGSSRVLSYESYYAGLLTPTISLLKGKLQTQFEKQGADLKAYVESLV